MKKTMQKASAFFKWIKKQYSLIEWQRFEGEEKEEQITWRDIWYYCISLVRRGKVKKTLFGWSFV